MSTLYLRFIILTRVTCGDRLVGDSNRYTWILDSVIFQATTLSIYIGLRTRNGQG